jgi:hypothetical protein
VSGFDPAYLWPDHESRAVSFENPTGERSSGGRAAAGRKGAPNCVIPRGERVVLADLAGPGRVTHVWMTVARLRALDAPSPKFLRAQLLEVFYDDVSEPSVSVPAPDLFGVVHGVPASYASSLTACNDGLGLDARIPMPFDRRLRIEYENASDEAALLYYQVDVLLGPQPDGTGVLHATFTRENPTTLERDLVILDGLRGPGRFFGLTGGVRTSDRRWWGEGEVKVYFDGESEPTICGTGTEDYLGSAWGLGEFAAPESGAPLVAGPGPDQRGGWSLVSFYRWHLSDPIVFRDSIKVTLQQIGSAVFQQGEEQTLAMFRDGVTTAGEGWIEGRFGAFTLYERSDDWCVTAFAFCRDPQPVLRVDASIATADLEGIPEGHRRIRR